MTIFGLVTNIGIIALIASLIIIFGLKKHKSYLMTFLQCFTGILFIFSGWVKAVDPMGTAYKMEQYFAEFESTFSQTFLSFLSPIFPALSKISIWFSVGMIVFEIVLGIMLLFGIKPKLSSWLFFLLVAFFTVLTGFTYLTGYVPSGVNFFDFANWGPYKATNMKVTDCGCFGDFIKLEPKMSFFKDVALLFPSVYFLFNHKLMHELLDLKWNKILTWGSTALLLLYCLYNFVWTEPHIDFRPFKNGTNIAQIKAEEEKAKSEVKILAYQLKDKTNGKIIEIPFDQYLNDTLYQDKNKYEALEQIKSKPRIPSTKISEFSITDFDGIEKNELFLANPKNHFMIISPKVKVNTETKSMIVKDSSFVIDTIIDKKTKKIKVDKKFIGLQDKEVKKTDFIWPQSFLDDLKKIKPIVDQASKEGCDISVVIGGVIKEAANDLANETGIKAEYLTADDILLKTIMRSNPGLILWKNGTLVHKWHKNQLPDYASIKSIYLK